MKNQYLFFLLLPVMSNAQRHSPRFENDTLYTSCGYKIYKGQTLQLGKGLRHDGKFRYINIKNDIASSSLTNTKITVSKVRNFGISVLGNAYIEIVGYLIFKDGSKGYADLHMAFDKATESFPGFPGELIVPEEFRTKDSSVADEIIKLDKLYKDGLITKEQFETQKNKLLDR